jgi:phosphatidylserine/phosphatidylglycerophosphate/cardiolipin synthase-like enzyme
VRALLLGERAGPVTAAHMRQLERLIATGDSAASNLLPTAGNRFRLVDSATAFADQLVVDIRSAQQHINFTEYAIHPGKEGGPVSAKVLNALKDAVADGIPVTAQLDALGSGIALGNRERVQMVQQLRDAGVKVTVRPFSLGRGGLDDARAAVDHRKIFEIDGRISWSGGMNLVDEWSPWHDLMIRIEGPASAQLGAVIAARSRDLGQQVTAQRIEVLRRGLSAPVDDAQFATRVLTDGNRHRRELSDAFVAATRTAKDRFWLMDPYLSDPRAMREVVGAAERLGPDAHLFLSTKVTGGGQLQDVFTDPLRRAWAYKFAEAGGEVHVTPSFSHAKGWIIDDVAGVGSHNKDRSSMRRSYENLVATNDPGAVALLESAMQHQRGVSTQASNDTVAGWRNLARVRDAFNLQY